MLDIIGNFARNNDCIILNISNLHSEYYGRANYSNVQSWRDYVEHFSINSWSECVQRLENYDAVGVDWLANDDGTGRFDGNFWWATSSYLSKLPTLDQLKATNITIESLKDKWIGMCKPKVGVLFNSGINDHARTAIPKSLYLDGTIAATNPEIVPPVPRAKREPALEPHRIAVVPKISQNPPPPLIPVKHIGRTPALPKINKNANRSTNPRAVSLSTMKLLIDCRKGDTFLKNYINAITDSGLYDRFMVRVALFNTNDYAPLNNFICYGPDLSEEVVASIPIGVSSYVMYIDASAGPSAADITWITRWMDNVRAMQNAGMLYAKSGDNAHIAWVINSEINKRIL
jgi:hypothetical protein